MERKLVLFFHHQGPGIELGLVAAAFFLLDHLPDPYWMEWDGCMD